jgi:hypothetical protein
METKPSDILSFLFSFGGTGIWTSNSPLLGRHSTTWTTLPDFFLLGIFKIGSHKLFAWGWIQIALLLISASWVAWIMGMRHWHLAILGAIFSRRMQWCTWAIFLSQSTANFFPPNPLGKWQLLTFYPLYLRSHKKKTLKSTKPFSAFSEKIIWRLNSGS